MEKLYDPIRKCEVIAYPEEIVRQHLIKEMIEKLGYPASHLAVEKDLSSLPHLQNKQFSADDRRLDLLCFAKDIHPNYPLYPLLLIECKAHPLTEKVFSQVDGYNHHVGAVFICIANEKERKTTFFDEKIGAYQQLSYLPSYQQLLDAVSLKT